MKQCIEKDAELVDTGKRIVKPFIFFIRQIHRIHIPEITALIGFPVGGSETMISHNNNNRGRNGIFQNRISQLEYLLVCI